MFEIGRSGYGVLEAGGFLPRGWRKDFGRVFSHVAAGERTELRTNGLWANSAYGFKSPSRLGWRSGILEAQRKGRAVGNLYQPGFQRQLGTRERSGLQSREHMSNPRPDPRPAPVGPRQTPIANS